MNVHISYKISKTSDLEKLINQQIEKLEPTSPGVSS